MTFQHQLVAYSGEFNDVLLNDLWADYVGDHGMYNKAILWILAREEGRNAKLLSPQEAVDAMTIKEGYEVNAFAAEPMITQPMAFCWDDRGRLWVAENRDYENRQEGFSNDGTSRILILEDTDHDGTADKRTVFLENIPFPSAIAVGFDGLYLGAPPNFLFVPDKNHDDKADVDDIEVLLTGWGIRDRHETINSLHWGPDGWLYGLEGFATPSKIRKPTGKGRIYRHKEPFPEDLLEADGIDINGGVWRYHPTKHRFEVVAHGFSNPWGIDYDAKGQLLITACVIPHLFHVIPGGIYQRQGGSHFNPYVYEDIQTIVDHRHRSAHGGARVYNSDAFPEEERGRIFMANIHEHAVLSDILKPNGSGFIASHGDDFMLANNAQWIGFSVEVGPEGGLYVLDWHDADICGNDVVHKETGRVFRIMPTESAAEQWEGRYADLGTFSDAQLIELQESPSDWHARRARVILQHRAATGKLSSTARAQMKRRFEAIPNKDHRLRLLWTMFVANGLSEQDLQALLLDKDPYIQSWAVQFLTEDKQVSSQTLEKLESLAIRNNSPIVRLYLAAALQRLPLAQRWNLATTLAQRTEDIHDHNIPLMLWFAIEPLVIENPTQAMELANQTTIPLLAKHIARRLVDGNELDVLVAGLNPQNMKEQLLQGMLASMEGRTDLTAPPAWDALYAALKNHAQFGPISLQIAQQFGSTEAAKTMLASLTSNEATTDDQNNAINSLASLQHPELLPLLPQLLEKPPLRIEAIRAAAAYADEDLGALLLAKYPTLNNAEKQEVLQTMSTRSVYGWQLAQQIKAETITKREVPVYVAMQLKRVVGNGFVEIWGPLDDISADKQTAFAKYQRLLNQEALKKADLAHGRSVFQQTCGACHQMYGEGGEIGPDLTGSNRANLSYLLSNILDPSGDLQDDYKLVVITTRDGRSYSGNVIAENDRQLTLRVVGQDPVLINLSDIQSREVTTQSMMPEGLLNTLTDQEVIDLVAYLQTNEEISL